MATTFDVPPTSKPQTPPRRQLRLWHLFVLVTLVAAACALIAIDPLLGGVIAFHVGLSLGLWWFRWSLWLSVPTALFAISIFLLPTLSHPLEARHGPDCRNHLKMIGLALHSYHDHYGSFPPAVVRDSEERPLYSWRVLILPWIGEEALYESFRLDEPWDSPHNRNLVLQKPDCFRCPTAEPRGIITSLTRYVAIVGDDTIWPKQGATTLEDITDGSSQTLLVVEWPESDIVWSEPRDLDVANLRVWMYPPPQKSAKRHGGGVNVMWADVSVFCIAPQSLPGPTLRAALTRAGKDRVDTDEFQ